jgi:catechol 2,3-dioxygenase-like lactoylglutathione lyase family enzyme
VIQGLRTVIDKVADLERAKTWYTRILGIEPYFAEPFFVGYQVGGFELGLDPDAGRLRLASIRDPFGNVFGIIENPQFSPSKVR